MKNAQSIFCSFIFIMVVWIVGLSTFTAGSTFAIFIFNKLYIDQAYYYLFEVLLNGDSNKYAANYGILLIICMFATSIIIYLVLKFLLFKIPKLNRFENYFYSNLKLLNKCMTLGVVFFGFFPLYLSLVKVDGNLTKEINVLVLLFSAGFFVPYVSLLLESIYRILVKENNEEMDKENSSEKRNDIPFLGDAEGRVLSGKKKIYKLIRKRSAASTVKNRNSWTFTLAVLGITGTICFLLITEKVDIDSSTLLSLILAFFSIYLSAQFYFKATEQSNQFYNTAFNHNKNISESLSGMRGEFGTSLRMLEESSSSMRNQIKEMNNLSGNIHTSNQLQEILKDEFKGLFDKAEIEAEERERYNELLKQQSELLKDINSDFERVKKPNENNSNNSVFASITVENNNDKLRNIQKNYLNMFFLEPFNSSYSSELSKSGITKSEVNRLFREFEKAGDLKIMIKEQLKFERYTDMSGNLTNKGYHLIMDFIKNN